MIRDVLLHHTFFAKFHVTAMYVTTFFLVHIEIMHLCIVEILKFGRAIVTFQIES